MKCAILGNGPSHQLYKSSKEYSAVIGCNVPWTKVDWTVVMDEDLVRIWEKNRDLISVPTYFSVKSWARTDSYHFREYLLSKSLFMGLDKPERASSGHMAAAIAISQGYKEIDLYGFDSFYSDNVDSLTRKYIIHAPFNNSQKWRKEWLNLMSSNGVVLNFIKE